MYLPEAPNDDLEQGDLCWQIPVPIMNGKEELVKSEVESVACPPTEELCNSTVRAMYLPVAIATVAVISQSCDLVAVDACPSKRILVALTVPDNDPRIAAYYEEDIQKTAAALAKKVLTQFSEKNEGPAAQAYEKTITSMKRSRGDTLKKLWSGNLYGAFPLAQCNGVGGRTFPRSVCFFDDVISLPSSWAPILKKRRFQRLNPTWKSVLQESLQQWLSRFAYPGTSDERVKVGLAAEDMSS